ncbi:MAG TPA: PAS domain S-box protein [Bryobacteraceae bacterium]|nr:PAS domain S-box protein [Bryobacteraceae bacterium]
MASTHENNPSTGHSPAAMNPPPAAAGMAGRLATHNWAATPLGARERWPEALNTAVQIVMSSRFPMFIWWGPDLINIYNDAYIPMLGEKHPNGFGRPASEAWYDIWDVVGAQAELVIHHHQATWNEEVLLLMERHGYTEETYFTWSYSPMGDGVQAAQGLFCAVTEDTSKVFDRRRLRTLREVASETADLRTRSEVFRCAADVMARNPHDIPFALLYEADADAKTVALAATVGVSDPPASGISGNPWGLDLNSNAIRVVDHLERYFDEVPAGPWPVRPSQAIIVPFAHSGETRPAGFMIAGISSYLRLNDEYRGFLTLIASHIAAAVANSRAYEAERQRAEALAEIDRAKTTFFSNVSHEFRTPLTLMIGPLEDVLARPADRAPEDREQIELAYRNSLRLLKLVNALLDFARIEAGRIQAAYEPTDVARLTAELAAVFRSAIERAGMRLVIDCPALREPYYVDREMWEKIVLNLLSNAFKFTFEGEIAVRVRESGGNLELKVSDTGTGVPPEELPQLFDRFHRVKGALGRSYEGSGIGLALVQELARLHGGSVSVESEMGRGSTFTVLIPGGDAHLPGDRVSLQPAVEWQSLQTGAYLDEILRWLPGNAARKPLIDGGVRESVPQTQTRRQQRILLADDNSDMREYVGRLLEQAGYSVEAVADGIAAFEAARTNRPDLILADVMMPGADGFELLSRIRADGNLVSVPLILLSARAGEEALIEGMGAGADDYLTKPFSARELLARVEAHLKMAQLRQESAAALRARTEQFETLINRAPMGIYLLDSEFRIRQVNPAAIPVFGDFPGGIEGRSFDEVMHVLWEKDYADEVLRICRHTQSTGEPYYTPERAEYRADRGVVEFYEWRVERIPLPDGGFGVVCYFRDVSTQVAARLEIGRSEERFRALVTATSDIVYRMSPDWREMHFLEGRDFIPDTTDPSRSWVQNYIHPDDQPRVLEALEEAIRTNSMFHLEHRVIRPDGSLGWTLSRAVPVRDAKGEIVEWFGAAADITERKRAEGAIAHITAESERQRRLYQAILSTTPDLAYVFDLNHRFTYANEALLTMWGKTAAEAIGKNCLELGYEPWHAAMHDREIEQVIATKKPIRGDVPFSGTSGRRIYDYIFVPVLDAAGNVEAIAGTTRDVTDRTIAEERIRDSEARLRFMAESMPQMIFTAQPDGEMNYFNRQWLEFAGMTYDDLQGWRWTGILHPEDESETLRLWRHSIGSGEPFQFTHRLRRTDGSYRWHLSRAHAMRGADNGIMMWIGSSTEIHEQKNTEEELRRANKDLEQFAYAASHDLQEPLRGIRIYSELLENRYKDRLDARGLQFLEFLNSGASRMEMLVRDLLAYTQIARFADSDEPMDAGKALQIALDNLSEAIRESGAAVTSSTLPPVLIPLSHLQQLFQNLIGNAIKYRRENVPPMIHVDARRQGTHWIFTVTDNGIGIEPEYKEQIFGLFKRLHNGDIYSGTGIGLALCQRIVERNHGRIWVESEPGAGSKFHFTIPG